MTALNLLMWRSVAVVLLACAALVAGAAQGGARAQSPEPEDLVCVAKTDRTGGRMRFVVLESDAATFVAAGFETVGCPDPVTGAVDAQEVRCAVLRNEAADSKETIRDLMGLTVEQMCAATDRWAAQEARE